MKIFNAIFSCFLATFFLSGCAPTRTWIISPEFQSADNATYSARFTPIKGSGRFINEFRLEVKNKTRQPLEIDWNSTRYLYNQGPSGRFAFEGITEKNINNPPSDVVPPEGTLQKIISPVNLIAWRHGPGYANLPAFSAGPVPEGQNGILLVVRQNGNEIREKMTVTIKVKAE
ncbi:MAG: hypothetical protein WB818_03600 [Desulfobacterales bacterium]|jgi:hypothetical protein